jgi:beta-glucosidase
MPKTVVTPLDALRHELGANLIYEVGAVVQEGVLELPGAELQNPKTGKPGVRVDFIDQNGEVSFSEDRLSSGLIWLGAAVPLPKSALLEIQTIYTPTQSGSVLLGYASAQPVSLEVDGVEFLSAHLQSRSDDPFTTIMDPPHTSKEINLIAGQSYHLRAKVDLSGREGVSLRSQNFVLGLETDGSLGDGLIESAVKQAEEADLAIVVVGTNAQVESEGFDRSDLSLPGRQNELVEAVLAVNPNTIIIVNSGSPVLMPWRHKARAILLSYFGGQEMGNGLMDVLSGVTEPGGRLPTTWPDKLEHVPVLNCLASQPGNYVDYEEGIHIGYRAWLKQGTKPAYEFGYGLGYTTWSIEAVKVPTQSRPGKDLKALVSVKNTGNRAGKHVVQIYASRTDSTIDRPVRWLVGFAVVYAQPGEKVLAEVSISGREFAHWSDGWKYEPGKYELHIGTSVERLELQTSIEIGWV